MNGQQPQQPPPPYTAPYESFTNRRDIAALHGSSPYGINQCSIHPIQNCHCMQVQCKVEVSTLLTYFLLIDRLTPRLRDDYL